MVLMLDAAACGEGMQIAGNHCDKSFRYRQGRRIEIEKNASP
jgi:hypothetical protein